MQHELLIDILVLVAVALMGAGAWLAFGLPATLFFSGVTLLALAAALAMRKDERRDR